MLEIYEYEIAVRIYKYEKKWNSFKILKKKTNLSLRLSCRYGLKNNVTETIFLKTHAG